MEGIVYIVLALVLLIGFVYTMIQLAKDYDMVKKESLEEKWVLSEKQKSRINSIAGVMLVYGYSPSNVISYIAFANKSKRGYDLMESWIKYPDTDTINKLKQESEDLCQK